MGFTFLPVQDPVAIGAQGDALLDLFHRRRKLVVLDQEMDRLLVRPIHMVEINDYTEGCVVPQCEQAWEALNASQTTFCFFLLALVRSFVTSLFF
jgi:hypothetical protein